VLRPSRIIRVLDLVRTDPPTSCRANAKTLPYDECPCQQHLTRPSGLCEPTGVLRSSILVKLNYPSYNQLVGE
jgi:hypothetical protein